MNCLDALATAAKGGAGIVRVPCWQAEADLAAGRLVRLLADYEPAPVHCICVPAVAAGFAEDRAFVDYLVERWRGIDPFGGNASPA